MAIKSTVILIQMQVGTTCSEGLRFVAVSGDMIHAASQNTAIEQPSRKAMRTMTADIHIV